MWLALISWAFAAPTVHVSDDGAVTGVVELSTSAADLRSRLADPTWLPTISKDGTTVTVAGRAGSCLLVDSASPNPVITVRYRTRQCPTDLGYESTLIQSDQFSEYAASWTITPTPQGSRATYVIRVKSTLWLPEAVVRRGVRTGIEQMLTNLEAWSKGARAP